MKCNQSRPTLIIITTTVQPNSGLCQPCGSLSKNKRKRKEISVPRPHQRTKTKTPKTMEHEGDTNCIWFIRNKLQSLGKGTEKIGWDHSDNSIINISENTEKSTGYLRDTCCHSHSVKNHQLTLVWKNLNNIYIYIERERERSLSSPSDDMDAAIWVQILDQAVYVFTSR